MFPQRIGQSEATFDERVEKGKVYSRHRAEFAALRISEVFHTKPFIRGIRMVSKSRTLSINERRREDTNIGATPQDDCSIVV